MVSAGRFSPLASGHLIHHYGFVRSRPHLRQVVEGKRHQFSRFLLNSALQSGQAWSALNSHTPKNRMRKMGSFVRSHIASTIHPTAMPSQYRQTIDMGPLFMLRGKLRKGRPREQ